MAATTIGPASGRAGPFVQASNTTSGVLALELLLAGAKVISTSKRTMRLPQFVARVVPVLPDYESVLADGEKRACWLLFRDRAVPPRIRVFADELAAY